MLVALHAVGRDKGDMARVVRPGLALERGDLLPQIRGIIGLYDIF